MILSDKNSELEALRRKTEEQGSMVQPQSPDTRYIEQADNVKRGINKAKVDERARGIAEAVSGDGETPEALGVSSSNLVIQEGSEIIFPSQGGISKNATVVTGEEFETGISPQVLEQRKNEVGVLRTLGNTLSTSTDQLLYWTNTEASLKGITPNGLKAVAADGQSWDEASGRALGELVEYTIDIILLSQSPEADKPGHLSNDLKEYVYNYITRNSGDSSFGNRDVVELIKEALEDEEVVGELIPRSKWGYKGGKKVEPEANLELRRERAHQKNLNKIRGLRPWEPTVSAMPEEFKAKVAAIDPAILRTSEDFDTQAHVDGSAVTQDALDSKNVVTASVPTPPPVEETQALTAYQTNALSLLKQYESDIIHGRTDTNFSSEKEWLRYHGQLEMNTMRTVYNLLELDSRESIISPSMRATTKSLLEHWQKRGLIPKDYQIFGEKRDPKLLSILRAAIVFNEREMESLQRRVNANTPIRTRKEAILRFFNTGAGLEIETWDQLEDLMVRMTAPEALDQYGYRTANKILNAYVTASKHGHELFASKNQSNADNTNASTALLTLQTGVVSGFIESHPIGLLGSAAYANSTDPVVIEGHQIMTQLVDNMYSEQLRALLGEEVFSQMGSSARVFPLIRAVPMGPPTIPFEQMTPPELLATITTLANVQERFPMSTDGPLKAQVKAWATKGITSLSALLRQYDPDTITEGEQENVKRAVEFLITSNYLTQAPEGGGQSTYLGVADILGVSDPEAFSGILMISNLLERSSGGGLLDPALDLNNPNELLALASHASALLPKVVKAIQDYHRNIETTVGTSIADGVLAEIVELDQVNNSASLAAATTLESIAYLATQGWDVTALEQDGDSDYLKAYVRRAYGSGSAIVKWAEEESAWKQAAVRHIFSLRQRENYQGVDQEKLWHVALSLGTPGDGTNKVDILNFAKLFPPLGAMITGEDSPIDTQVTVDGPPILLDPKLATALSKTDQATPADRSKVSGGSNSLGTTGLELSAVVHGNSFFDLELNTLRTSVSQVRRQDDPIGPNFMQWLIRNSQNFVSYWIPHTSAKPERDDALLADLVVEHFDLTRLVPSGLPDRLTIPARVINGKEVSPPITIDLSRASSQSSRRDNIQRRITRAEEEIGDLKREIDETEDEAAAELLIRKKDETKERLDRLRGLISRGDLNNTDDTFKARQLIKYLSDKTAETQEYMQSEDALRYFELSERVSREGPFTGQSFGAHFRQRDETAQEMGLTLHRGTIQQFSRSYRTDDWFSGKIKHPILGEKDIETKEQWDAFSSAVRATDVESWSPKVGDFILEFLYLLEASGELDRQGTSANLTQGLFGRYVPGGTGMGFYGIHSSEDHYDQIQIQFGGESGNPTNPLRSYIYFPAADGGPATRVPVPGLRVLLPPREDTLTTSERENLPVYSSEHGWENPFESVPQKSALVRRALEKPQYITSD